MHLSCHASKIPDLQKRHTTCRLAFAVLALVGWLEKCGFWTGRIRKRKSKRHGRVDLLLQITSILRLLRVAMKSQKGFTLLEVILVIAIIAVLAAITLPAYSGMMSRSKVMAGVAEISLLKTLMQSELDQGRDVASVGDLGGATASSNCSDISASGFVATGVGAVSCTLVNGPAAVNGKTVTWARTGSAGWACSTTAASEYAPVSCPGS